jgi:hypothetical protein
MVEWHLNEIYLSTAKKDYVTTLSRRILINLSQNNCSSMVSGPSALLLFYSLLVSFLSSALAGFG